MLLQVAVNDATARLTSSRRGEFWRGAQRTRLGMRIGGLRPSGADAVLAIMGIKLSKPGLLASLLRILAQIMVVVKMKRRKRRVVDFILVKFSC